MCTNAIARRCLKFGALALAAGLHLAGPARSTAAGEWRSIGPSAGSISALVVSPSVSGQLYAGSATGVFRSRDGGTTWLPAGLAWEDVRSLAIHPQDPEIVLAGTGTAIWRTGDGGASWERAWNDSWADGVLDVEVAPSDPRVAYAGTGRRGALVSRDGGTTWSPVPGMCWAEWRPLRMILVHPARPEVVWVVSSSELCRSTDGGATWSDQSAGLPEWRYIQDAVMIPGTHETVVVCTSEGVFASRDDGESFTPADAGIEVRYDWARVASLAVVPGARSPILYCTTGDGRVYASWDGAAEWAEVGTLPAGASGLVADPHHSGRLWCPRGIKGPFRSDDAARSWQLSNLGLALVSVGSLLSTDSSLMAGAANLGVFHSQDNGSSWTLGSEGLPWQGGFECPAFVPTSLLPSPWTAGATLAVTSWGLFESTDLLHWITSWERQWLEGIAIGGGESPRAWAGTSQQDVHATCGGLYTRAGAADPWSPAWPGSDCMGGHPIAVAGDPDRPQRVFFAEEYRGVRRSDVGGATPEACASTLSPQGFDVSVIGLATGIVPGELWALSESGIFRSADGCASWRRQSSGLDTVVYTVMALPWAPGHVLAGTRDGVFGSRDGGDTWQPLNASPEVREVQALALMPDGRTLAAGTRGRGVYLIDCACQPGRVRRRLGGSKEPSGPEGS